MKTTAPLLSQPLRFVSRLAGVSGFDETRLAISITIEQPLLDLMFDLWAGLQAIPHANEVKSWSADLSYAVFDLVADPGLDGAQALELTGDRDEIVFGVPVVDAEERGFRASGCDITVYDDGDAVFHVNLNGVADALWTEGVFVLRNLVANSV